MLGSFVRVNILSDIEPMPVPNTRSIRVYTAEMTDSVRRNDGAEVNPRVYVFGQTTLAGILKLRVSALITNRNTGTVTCVAAPERVFVFGPQIYETIGTRMDLSNCDLHCLNEKSCGAVIYRKRSGNIEYLLVKNKRGGNWGFPKGHIEIGENEHDTALREVKEETGLDISLIDGFRVLSEYHPRGKIFKQVVFFLAEMPETGEVIPQQIEIDRYIWADFGLAMRTFRFNNDRNVLSKARDWLRTV